MSILLLFVFFVCIWFIKFSWSRRRLRELASQIPGPSTIPVLGNFLLVTGGSEQFFYHLRSLVDRYERKVFRGWFGHILYVFITNAEDVEQLCVKERLLNRDRYLIAVLEKFMGKGLITSRDEYWKQQRKIIAPTFRPNILETYLSVFNSQACVLVSQLEKIASGDEFDVYPVLSLCTLDMICESTMGINFKAQEGRYTYLPHFLLNLLYVLNKLVERPWLMFDTIFHLTSMGRKYKQEEKLLHDLSDNIIRNKLRELREEKPPEQMNKGTFLDILIRSSESEGAALSNKQLRDEVITLLLAGIETTATSMCFTLMMLAYHPQIQEDVHQELKEVFADDWERPVTPDDVKNLQLLNRVIKETMRLFPPVFFTLREATQEVKLSTCTIPEGCMLFIPIYFIHRDPRFFPDPERFDPDRFLPDKSQERHPYSYVPFGAGPRMCVGYKYAEMQMAVTLSTVLRKYKFMPAVPYECLHKLEITLITRPTSGFMVKMLPRS
ncbi:cytochrome P450 4C1 [Anabrus simplex]|uniref:cytochrome P450 4C1 n=1 Tax=Anabrus simplex TaxID=316456 RepID=UPI0035A2EE39